MQASYLGADIVSIVIRGQLVLEREVRELVNASVEVPSMLDESMSYGTQVRLLGSLGKLSLEDVTVLLAFFKMRHRAAHDLDSRGLVGSCIRLLDDYPEADRARLLDALVAGNVAGLAETIVNVLRSRLADRLHVHASPGVPILEVCCR